MDLNALSLVVLMIMLVCMAINLMFLIRRDRAVLGSHQRYVATTWIIATDIMVILSLLASSVIYFMQENLLGAGWDLVIVWIWVWSLKRFFDDDNWFNDQWKRLKRGIKKLRERIARATPSPLPSPT